nr:FKBP-type peptidyl-prolyl cis-trans isomerase [uncultured Sphingomonas sp.]
MKTFLILAPVALLAACAHAPTPPQTAAGPQFMERNAMAKKVVTLPSGVQYYVLASGPKTGRSPTTADSVTFDYEGKLTTGETFDSSFERGEPLSGKTDAFVPGFTEALTHMKPGDDWIVWIPPSLAYKDRDIPGIPPNSVLRFRMVLRSVQPGN